MSPVEFLAQVAQPQTAPVLVKEVPDPYAGIERLFNYGVLGIIVAIVLYLVLKYVPQLIASHNKLSDATIKANKVNARSIRMNALVNQTNTEVNANIRDTLTEMQKKATTVEQQHTLIIHAVASLGEVYKDLHLCDSDNPKIIAAKTTVEQLVRDLREK